MRITDMIFGEEKRIKLLFKVGMRFTLLNSWDQ